MFGLSLLTVNVSAITLFQEEYKLPLLPPELGAHLAALERLRGKGWFVYRFLDGSVRFMCSWATTPEMVEDLGAALADIA